MADNKYYRISYELFMREGDDKIPVLVEKTSKDNPFEFVTGLGYTLPDFEDNIVRLKAGDKFDFIIPKERAYGEYDESRVKTLPKETFRDDEGHFAIETVYPGSVVPMVNEDGMQFEGLVKEVNPTNVVVDFNHALAGVDLQFRGEVINSHDATPQEMTTFLTMMADNCEDCDGSCDCAHCNRGKE